MKLYIVLMSSYGEYDSWEVGYHLTRKGALRHIIARKYMQWELCRYITPGGYEDDHYWIREAELEE